MTDRIIQDNNFADANQSLTELAGNGSFVETGGVLELTIGSGVASDWWVNLPRQAIAIAEDLNLTGLELRVIVELTMTSVSSPNQDFFAMFGFYRDDQNGVFVQNNLTSQSAYIIDNDQHSIQGASPWTPGTRQRLVLDIGAPSSLTDVHTVSFESFDGTNFVSFYTEELDFLPTKWFIGGKQYGSIPGFTAQFDDLLVVATATENRVTTKIEDDFLDGVKTVQEKAGVGDVAEILGKLQIEKLSSASGDWTQGVARAGKLAFWELGPYTENDRVVWAEFDIDSLTKSTNEGEGIVGFYDDDLNFFSVFVTTGGLGVVIHATNGIWSYPFTRNFSYPLKVRIKFNRPTAGNPNNARQLTVFFGTDRDGWVQVGNPVNMQQDFTNGFMAIKSYQNNPQVTFKLDAVKFVSDSLGLDIDIAFNDHFDDGVPGVEQVPGDGVISEPPGGTLMTFSAVPGDDMRWIDGSPQSGGGRFCVLARRSLQITPQTKKIFVYCKILEQQSYDFLLPEFSLYADDQNHVFWRFQGSFGGQINGCTPYVRVNGASSFLDASNRNLPTGEVRMEYDLETNIITMSHFDGASFAQPVSTGVLPFVPQYIAWAAVGDSQITAPRSVSFDQVRASVAVEEVPLELPELNLCKDWCRVGLIANIEGVDVAISTDPRLDPKWSQGRVLAALDPSSLPSTMPMGIDPDTQQSESGGVTLDIVGDLSEFFQSLNQAPTTLLDQDADATVTTLAVGDASVLPASGFVWVGREAVKYSAISGNTLTGCIRASLGTSGVSHEAGVRVYPYPPTLYGRRVEIYWQDALFPTKDRQSTRYIGYIESYDETTFGTTRLSVISAQQKLFDRQALSAPWSKGRLHGPIGEAGDIRIQHDSLDKVFAIDASANYPCLFARVEDEIVRLKNIQYPSDEKIVTSPAQDQLFASDGFDVSLFIGQKFDIFSDAGDYKGSSEITFFSDGFIRHARIEGYVHALGDRISFPFESFVNGLEIERGSLFSVASAHDEDVEVDELRVFQGDIVTDVLFPILFSVEGNKQNGPQSGAFDILPKDWGVGLRSEEVDFSSFLELVEQGRTSERRYVFSEPLGVDEILVWLQQSCNCSVYWSEEGKLSCSIRGDLFPDMNVDFALSESTRKVDTLPSVSVRPDMVRNEAVVNMDKDLSDVYRYTSRVTLPESQEIYGARRIFLTDDPGLRSESSEVNLQDILYSWLQRRSRELLYIQYKAILDPDRRYRPGQLVTLVCPNLINAKGGRGVESVFEILRVVPNDKDGFVELELVSARLTENVALVAPCGLVESVSGSSIVLAPSSSSYYANSFPRMEEVPFLGPSTDGTSDIDYFVSGDQVTVWDESSLAGVPQRTTLEVSSVSYTSRTLTFLSSVPGFVQPGDIVKLAPWPVVKASTPQALRVGIYLCFADDSSSPLLGVDDDPYRWGV